MLMRKEVEKILDLAICLKASLTGFGVRAAALLIDFTAY